MHNPVYNQIPIVVLPLSDIFRLRTMLAMYEFYEFLTNFLNSNAYKHRATTKIRRPLLKENSFNTLTDFVKHVRNGRLAITASKCLVDDYLINLLSEQLENSNGQSKHPDYIYLKTDWTECYIKVGYINNTIGGVSSSTTLINEYSLNSRIRIQPAFQETAIVCKYRFKVNTCVEYFSAHLIHKQIKQLDELLENSDLTDKYVRKQIHSYSYQIKRALSLLFKHRLLKIPVDIQLDKHYSNYHCKYNHDCEIKLEVELPIWLKTGKRHLRTFQSMRQYPKLKERVSTKIINKVKHLFFKWRVNQQKSSDNQYLSPTQIIHSGSIRINHSSLEM